MIWPWPFCSWSAWGFRLTVETTHEWAGVILFALFGLHTWFNLGWYRNLFKGTYSFRRVVNTTVNLCLLGLMLLLLVGGLMNAHLLKFFGVWPSFDREMGSKLFLGFGFDYWDPERPAALFYLSTLSVMCLYVFISYCFMRLAASVSRRFTRDAHPIAGEAATGK